MSDTNQSKLIRGYVVLKGRGGSSLSNTSISSRNIGELTSTRDAREEVSDRLKELGFSIRRVSPLSITVEAPPEKFEVVFHGRLKRAQSSEHPSDNWGWSELPEIPKDLRDKVDTVVFPEPVELHF